MSEGVRKPYDEIKTHDGGAYSRFIASNICNASSRWQRDNAYWNGTGFSADARAFSAGDFTIVRNKTKGGKIQHQREAADIAADNQRRYTISLPITGFSELRQLGRESECRPGSMIMMSGSDLLSLQKSFESDTLTVMLPQDFVETRMTRSDDICARATPIGSLQRLIFASASALHETAADMASEELQKAVGVVGELVLLALGNLTDARSSVSPVRAANLMRAKRIIQARCSNPDLTLENVAKECGLSVRYLHVLFQDDGRTFRQYIVHERLHRAHHRLRFGSPATTNITDVAFAVGFSNVSHFSTAFRRVFSVAPRDVLRQGVK